MARAAYAYADQYAMRLVHIPPGTKGPRHVGWNQPGGYFEDPEIARRYFQQHPDCNLGVVLGPSNLCSLDIDDMESAIMVLSEFGLDLADLQAQYPTIQGNPARCRVMFSVPAGMTLSRHALTWPRKDDPDNLFTVLELRAGDVQDVVPPSIHPETQQPYRWITRPNGQFPALPERLLAIWSNWPIFRGQAEALCPWGPSKPPPMPAQSTGDSMISRYVAGHAVTDVLSRYGYTQAGKRWLSPHSTTKLPGVVIMADGIHAWIHHTSDPLCSDTSGQPVNAFDLYCHYEHGGDPKAAARAIWRAHGSPARQDPPSGVPAAQNDSQAAADTPDAPTPWPQGDWSAERLLEVDPPQRRFLVKDRLLANRAHLVTGIGGSSKTRFLYQVAVGAVLGRTPWGWQFERTGRAVLLLAEDTEEDAAITLHAIASSLNLSGSERAKVAANLSIITLAGEAAVMLERLDGTVVANHRAHGFIAWLKALEGLVFVGIDPALAISNGNEGDPVHQRRLGEWVDHLAIESDSCAMLATHAAKAVQSAEHLLSHTSRGGGAITDAVRAEFVLRTMTVDEAKAAGLATEADRARHVQLKATKGNSLPPEAFEPVWLMRDNAGSLVPAEIDLQAGDDTKASPLRDREVAAYDTLWNLGQGHTVERAAWQQALEERGILTGSSPDARKKAMDRLIKALFDRHQVVSVSRGRFAPRSTPVGQV